MQTTATDIDVLIAGRGCGNFLANECERCVKRILFGEVFGRTLLVWDSRSRKSGHAGEA